MPNTCSTCKHWQDNGYHYGMFNVDRHTCDKVGEDGFYVITQGDDCMPMLVTPPEFGCILWETKEREAVKDYDRYDEKPQNGMIV